MPAVSKIIFAFKISSALTENLSSSSSFETSSTITKIATCTAATEVTLEGRIKLVYLLIYTFF